LNALSQERSITSAATELSRYNPTRMQDGALFARFEASNMRRKAPKAAAGSQYQASGTGGDTRPRD
jgi:hypothetical protein